MAKATIRFAAAASIALVLSPSLSTVGVTGEDDLKAGRMSITHGMPVQTEAELATMRSIDARISSTITAER